MKCFFDDRQLAHAPEHYFRWGNAVPHPEQPERAIQLRDALTAAGHVFEMPDDFGQAPIKAVHDPDFVDFFKDARARWDQAVGSDAPAVPNYHTPRVPASRPTGIVGQLGYYSTGTSCPVTHGTWQAIYWSAQSAVAAADAVLKGERIAYGLSRPPGHHAYRDATDGFCFFNNAAIAAQHLRQRFERVTILDIDTHAGNGTLSIFYQRADVQVISLHVDPSDYPPYFIGYPDEKGEGAGEGTSLNVTLAPGAKEPSILKSFDECLEALKGFAPQAVVVSLGFDLSEDDPLSVVQFSTQGFQKMAGAIMDLGLPTVLVQEGGYLGPSLSKNAVAFLEICDNAL